MYARGIGVEQNGEKAVKWLSRAAAQGQVDALYAEAVLYDQGIIVPRDDNLAFLKYELSLFTAPVPWFVQGFAYIRALSFRLSSSDHLRYKQALGYEYDKTLRPLGDMYFEGRGTIRDLEMAKWLYKKAAKNGDELAQKKYAHTLPPCCVISGSLHARVRVVMDACDLILRLCAHTPGWRSCALYSQPAERRRWRSMTIV
jgi:hypothetical protein